MNGSRGPRRSVLGEIFERGPDWQVVATCDLNGWKPF